MSTPFLFSTQRTLFGLVWLNSAIAQWSPQASFSKQMLLIVQQWFILFCTHPPPEKHLKNTQPCVLSWLLYNPLLPITTRSSPGTQKVAPHEKLFWKVWDNHSQRYCSILPHPPSANSPRCCQRPIKPSVHRTNNLDRKLKSPDLSEAIKQFCGVGSQTLGP